MYEGHFFYLLAIIIVFLGTVIATAIAVELWKHTDLLKR